MFNKIYSYNLHIAGHEREKIFMSVLNLWRNTYMESASKMHKNYYISYLV